MRRSMLASGLGHAWVVMSGRFSQRSHRRCLGGQLVGFTRRRTRWSPSPSPDTAGQLVAAQNRCLRRRRRRARPLLPPRIMIVELTAYLSRHLSLQAKSGLLPSALRTPPALRAWSQGPWAMLRDGEGVRNVSACSRGVGRDVALLSRGAGGGALGSETPPTLGTHMWCSGHRSENVSHACLRNELGLQILVAGGLTPRR